MLLLSSVLVLLALLSLATANTKAIEAELNALSSSMSSNFGVDDDDTDASDMAGQKAHNHANNVEQFVTKYFDVIMKSCPYWPRSDYYSCETVVMACLLEEVTKLGELKDHITLKQKCKPGKKAKNAADVASNYAIRMATYVTEQEKWAKTFCGHGDDDCKDNVECRILADIATKYSKAVQLRNCPAKSLDIHPTTTTPKPTKN